MNIWKKIKNWWKKNQEKNSERYIEREDFKKELKEHAKDIEATYNSSAMDFQERTLEKAYLIQNIILQRKLTQVTDGLKTATWILAIATGVFALATIIDSPNSSYFISTLKGLGEIAVYFFLIALALALIWNFFKFIFRFFKKIFHQKFLPK